ncbi:SEC-C domain-containing protein [Planctomicrobium piriforme]|uniref:SEC-C motif-containing protein n=1 Tax=Planctomicrobium piriforme TaxID=1576369 RepID=A0A1I3MUN9_9PLAN|nr:SEC-C domain-containing protein [Planctomicrobium piriforme]SFJ00824.1 hypothetical protein SAMN05421753_114118 [Planctomicrobium piriforme]
MDSYALCPCGSGKKVKFCCQPILTEMAKIEKLQENNQPRMALQLIDKLLKDHPQNAWLVNQRAMALIADERNEEARDGLVAFLRKNPEHPLSNGLLALAMTEIEPIDQCKKVIHRAFLKSMSAEPRIVAILAGKLVDYFMSAGHDMAARQHMAVVLRLEGEQERQRTLMAMLEFDSDTGIPYPLRGAHPMPIYQPSEALAPQVKKAQRLYVHACFSEAADLLDQVVQQDANSPELWHTIGLMRAWDGDEKRAAAALHQASTLYTDPEKAIDVETISQLLLRRQRENTIPAVVRTFDVESLSRLLTRLDNEDRLCRMPLQEQAVMSGVSAAYDVLDRPVPGTSELASATLDSVPRSIGQITLFDQDQEGNAPQAHVNALLGERLDESLKIFERAAGELAKPAAKEEGDDEVLGWYSKEDIALNDTAFFPPQTPSRVRNVLRRQFVEKSVPQIWLETPLAVLGGKSPSQAAGDESLKVSLTAAVRVLDSFMDRRGVMLDVAALREQLKLAPPTPIAVAEDKDVNTFSLPQLLRLETKPLSDEMFERLLQRAIVIKHSGLGYRLLSEFVNDRPQLVEKKSQEAEQAYITLSDLASRSMRDEDAFEWLSKGFQFSKAHGNAFETQLMWKMREVSLRARDTDDPAFKAVLLEVWNHYGAKLPAVRARLEEFVRALGVEAPWQSAILTPQAAGAAGNPIWTAETQSTASGEKKLWLPD